MANHHILNLTIQLDADIMSLWLKAIKEEILPKVVDGEVVLSADVRKIITSNDNEDPSYAIQFTFPSIDIYKEKKLEHLSIFIEMMDRSFANKYVYFVTLMEVLHYYKTST